VEILYLARKAGVRVREVPVLWRNAAGTKVNALIDPFDMLKDIARFSCATGSDDMGGWAHGRKRGREDMKRRGSPAKILKAPRAAARVRLQQKRGRAVVFTNGCFDLLHAGHVSLLEAARARGISWSSA